jgi:c-di-GMP-binding flagellar brake protein YcgR
MAANNRRKHRRVPLAQEAVIHINRKLIAKCTVCDISKAGARLFVEKAVEVPTEFTLRLSRNGAVRRQCKQMWRAGNEIGVRFLDGKQ